MRPFKQHTAVRAETKSRSSSTEGKAVFSKASARLLSLAALEAIGKIADPRMNKVI
jgi:hypothetical protein